MNKEERPIVFTITHLGKKRYQVITVDPRGKEFGTLRTGALFVSMRTIAEELNNKGYAVLFEVD